LRSSMMVSAMVFFISPGNAQIAKRSNKRRCLDHSSESLLSWVVSLSIIDVVVSITLIHHNIVKISSSIRK
jgi:hypothetical protein